MSGLSWPTGIDLSAWDGGQLEVFEEGVDSAGSFYTYSIFGEITDWALSPPCVADVGLSYDDQVGKLRVSYVLGAGQPVLFSTWAVTVLGVFPIYRGFLPALEPPVSFPVDIPLEPIGGVGVAAFITDGSPENTCFDINVVDTGGAGLSVLEAGTRARDQVEALH